MSLNNMNLDHKTYVLRRSVSHVDQPDFSLCMSESFAQDFMLAMKQVKGQMKSHPDRIVNALIQCPLENLPKLKAEHIQHVKKQFLNPDYLGICVAASHVLNFNEVCELEMFLQNVSGTSSKGYLWPMHSRMVRFVFLEVLEKRLLEREQNASIPNQTQD